MAAILRALWYVQIEHAFHEMLLQSPHRTLDPDSADFFYVPVYTSCYIHPVWGWADTPWFHNPGGQTRSYVLSASGIAAAPGIRREISTLTGS